MLCIGSPQRMQVMISCLPDGMAPHDTLQRAFAGDDGETETAMSRKVRKLGNAMTALQGNLSSIPTALATELLSCLQQYVSDGKDAVLPAEEDVSPSCP